MIGVLYVQQTLFSARQPAETKKQGSSEKWEKDDSINLQNECEAEEDGSINPVNKDITQEQLPDKAKEDVCLTFVLTFSH